MLLIKCWHLWFVLSTFSSEPGQTDKGGFPKISDCPFNSLQQTADSVLDFNKTQMLLQQITKPEVTVSCHWSAAAAVPAGVGSTFGCRPNLPAGFSPPVVVLYSVCVLIWTSCIVFVYMFDTDGSLYIICCSPVLYKLDITPLAVGSSWLFCWFRTQIYTTHLKHQQPCCLIHISCAWWDSNMWNGLKKVNVFCDFSFWIPAH